MIRKTSVATVLLLAIVFVALGWLLPRGAAVASQGQTARLEDLEAQFALHVEETETQLAALAAAAPSVVAYQGYLTDAGGAPLDGAHTLRFSIHTAQTGGTQVWTETHTGVPVNDGYFSVLLGSAGTPLTADRFAGATRWIEVALDGSNLGERQQIAAVPYALQAASAPWSGVTGKPEVGFTIVQATNYLDLTTEWQDVPGMEVTLTPGEVESLHILAFGAFNYAPGINPTEIGDHLIFGLFEDETLLQEIGSVATGAVGVSARTFAYQIDLTAASSYAFKIRARNASGDRGRFTSDGQMIYWRIP